MNSAHSAHVNLPAHSKPSDTTHTAHSVSDRGLCRTTGCPSHTLSVVHCCPHLVPFRNSCQACCQVAIVGVVASLLQAALHQHTHHLSALITLRSEGANPTAAQQAAGEEAVDTPECGTSAEHLRGMSLTPVTALELHCVHTNPTGAVSNTAGLEHTAPAAWATNPHPQLRCKTCKPTDSVCTLKT